MADDPERGKIPSEDLYGFLAGVPETRAKIAAITERLHASELREADQELVSGLFDHLREKWGERACPYCQHTEWIIGSSIVAFRLLRGPALVPVFQITCGHCAHIVFIDAQTAGLWPGGVERLGGGDEE